MLSDLEADVHDLLNSGRVVAIIGPTEWEVNAVCNNRLWYRLRRRDKENAHPDDRRYLKIGVITNEERLRGIRLKLLLYTVRARDVLCATEAEGRVFVNIARKATA